MFMMFPQTSFTSKSVHFVWSELVEIFKAQTLAMVLGTAQGWILATMQSSYFLEGN